MTSISALLAWVLTVVILMAGCAHDPLIDLICRDEPDKQRCIDEQMRKNEDLSQ